MNPERVMLLIDADNVSIDVMEQAVRLVHKQHGGLHVRRAYCTAESAVKHQSAFKRLGIKPMVNLAAGKNSTDIALAVDAIDLVLAERPDVVVIASSDSDFAPLVQRLREKGCVVRGIGQHGKTGDETQDVYDDYTVLEHRKPPAPAEAPAPSRRAPARKTAAKKAPAAPKALAKTAAAPAPAKKAARRTAKEPAAAPAPSAAVLPAPAAMPVAAATPVPEPVAAADAAPDATVPAPVEPVAPARAAKKTATKAAAAKKPRKTVARKAAGADAAQSVPAEPEAEPATAPAAPPQPVDEARPATPPVPAAAAVPPPAAAPAHRAREAAHATASAAAVFDCLPELAAGQTLAINVAVQRLREARLLGKNASSSKLFAQLADRVELLPADKPTQLRRRA